ncbi:MAG: agmatinase [Acidobacteria bacterium]|nr:agmatinase [Acidobacteriota bacterium]
MRFMGSRKEIEGSRIILRGYPYDGTASYKPGSRFGPMEIRTHSEGIESYSPRFDVDIEEIPFTDTGDLSLPFGAKKRVLHEIEADADGFFDAGVILFGIGGEHLVSYSLIHSAFRKYPDLRVFQFDAHMDLRNDYLGERFSHATVMRRILDFLPEEHFHQFHIRSGTREEWRFSRENGFMKDSLTAVLEGIAADIPLYVTIDMDVLDPAVFPGTGTPEPGGLSFDELISELAFFRGKRVVAADFVELAPHIDISGISTITAAKLIREMIGVVSG